MAVKASADTIRAMEEQLKRSIREIEEISRSIKSALSLTQNWNDSQSQSFNELMQKIADLSEEPLQTLEDAIPQMENLARALDDYNGVRF